MNRCDSCAALWTDEELDDIENFSMRVAPGGMMPAGQCPDLDCGALCFLVEEAATDTPTRAYPTSSGHALGLPDDVESLAAHVRIEASFQRHPALAPVQAFDGACIGYVLPDGRQLRPWIVWALTDPATDGERDLSGKDAYGVGIEMVDYTHNEIEDDIPIDDSDM